MIFSSLKIDKTKCSKNILLVLSSGGMMLSCFHAYSSFIFSSISQKPFLLPEGAAIIIGAILIAFFQDQVRWRRIYVIIFYLMGLLLSLLWLYHRYFELKKSFWSFSWFPDFFIIERSISDWYTLFLIILSVCILWVGGVRLYAKPPEQTIINHRFDLGLVSLILLLLIKLIIAVKGHFISIEPSSSGAILSFIILGLFSMGLVRTKNASQAEDVTYFKGAGIVLSFICVTLMLGGGLFILFISELQTVAKAGFNLFETLKDSIGQLVIDFALSSLRPGQFGSSAPELPAINQYGGDIGIIHYFFIGLGIVILLLTALLILPLLLTWFITKLKWLLLKMSYLFSRKEKGNGTRVISEIFWLFIYHVNNLFLSILIRILRNPEAYRTAQYAFKRLLRWGRLSGLKHTGSETPIEYGIRLGKRFPQIAKEIRLIIRLHDEVIYGLASPGSQQISRLRLALKRIHNPLLWFARIKSLCFQNRL
jgi:hypothetical protein